MHLLQLCIIFAALGIALSTQTTTGKRQLHRRHVEQKRAPKVHALEEDTPFVMRMLRSSLDKRQLIDANPETGVPKQPLSYGDGKPCGGNPKKKGGDCPWWGHCVNLDHCEGPCKIVKGKPKGEGCPADQTCVAVSSVRTKCYTSFEAGWDCEGGIGYKGLCLQECNTDLWPTLSTDCDLKPDRAGLYARCCDDDLGCCHVVLSKYFNGFDSSDLGF